ncbi:DUF2911 domain-containing protein [Flavobacteriaceae bacterium R38]|nr:DUF2911 domain-containing protein [Flavobacteriaceae bacterium R38]
MKKIAVFLCLMVFGVTLNAQVVTPQPSPLAKIEQKVGLTDVTVVYSRPSMKGRTIFGDLVPYGKVWRTGANANTVITFSDNVKIGGKTLEKGSYAIYTKPNANSWEVLFYNATNNWGNPANWEEDKVVASVSAEVHAIPFDVETFTIDFNNLTNNGAHLEILWEKTYVAVPIEVDTKKAVLASIDKTMKGKPSVNDYYSAAVFYLEEGEDIKQAKKWIDLAIANREEPAFWMYRQKSLIYAKMGDKKGAIAAAKESLALAKKANNNDYVKLNQDSLKEWGTL